MTWFRFQKSAAEERLHNLTAQYSEQSQEVRSARRSAEEKEAQVAKKQLRIRQLQEACDVAAARLRVAVRSSLVVAVFRLEKVNQQIERHPVGRMSNFKTADNRTKSLVMVRRQREVERVRVSEQSLTGSLAHLSRRRKSLRSFNKPSIASERSTRPSSTHMQPCFARLMTCGTRNGWL